LDNRLRLRHDSGQQQHDQVWTFKTTINTFKQLRQMDIGKDNILTWQSDVWRHRTKHGHGKNTNTHTRIRTWHKTNVTSNKEWNIKSIDL